MPDETARTILQTLIDEFDRVAYLLSKCTGIYFSNRYLKEMLDDYQARQGYLFVATTPLNIPWIFAYMTNAKELLGEEFRDKELQDIILQKIPGAVFEKDRLCRKDKGVFFDLQLSFIHHRTVFRGNQLIETIEMVITEGVGNFIFRKTIPFEYEYFQRLIHQSDNPYRNPEQCALAQEMLGALLLQ